jgi:hypothetical protein
MPILLLVASVSAECLGNCGIIYYRTDVLGKRCTPYTNIPSFIVKTTKLHGLCYHVLARCDSIFPLLRCQGVWNKTCTQLSPSQIVFQNLKN